MKINFTKKEYRLLVTMMEISDWVMHAHHDVERKDTEEYRILRNKILSYVGEMGMEDYYIKEGDLYYETREYEDNSKQTNFIDEYEEDSFWEQLGTRLVDRDYYQKFGDDEVDFETKAYRLTEIEKIYADEINEFGIANLIFTKNNKKNVIH